MPDLFGRIGGFLGKNRPWYKLPRLLAVPKLVEIRNELRKKNLHDTEEPPMPKRGKKEGVPLEAKLWRTFDGGYNDTGCPMMGATGRRFGRNFPVAETFPDTSRLMSPNPREVSNKLMARTEFQPATILNLLAAAWIQFMVHDWFVHKPSKTATLDIPVPAGDTWPDPTISIPATEPEPAPAGSTRPPAYANQNSHWWDGSQIYGSTEAEAAKIKSGKDGKLRLDDKGRLFHDPQTGLEVTGFTDNGWVGLALLHTLFTQEHNAICDLLRSKHPTWTDNQLYGVARLINCALMAKIHTVEWTCAIMPHPTIQLAMRTNWRGASGEDVQDVLRFLNESELLGGIVGSNANHHSAPYSLTEEFVSVYRMHTLLPDRYQFRSLATGAVSKEYTLPEVSGNAGRKIFAETDLTDLFYSFGVVHPGAVRLHNYPDALRKLERDDGTRMDLAAVDILRDRERGVPRYNRFRRLLHMKPVSTFEELTDNPQWAAEIKEVYGGDIEQVDLMVGLFAEPLPEGFGFSETAFRIFVLMASRRLKSDRFFTDDYRPEIYTAEGIEWVRKNGFASVLKRHYPRLASAVDSAANPFAPWKPVGGTA
jgi:hypothetical protein